MVKIDALDIEQAEEILASPTPDYILNSYNEIRTIDQNHIQLFQQNGYIKLENIIAGETLNFTNKIISAAVFLRKEQDKRSLSEKSEYEKTFLQCGYLCWDYNSIYNFVTGKRFGAIALELMQVEHVRLWHDQALFKEPGGNETSVHQDCSYWPITDPEYTITMWMALEDVTIDMGSLYFYRGTHDKKMKEYVDIFKNPHLPESIKVKEKTKVSLKAGDATFHSGMIFHGAGKNTTNIIRKGMTVIYLNDGNTFDSSDARNAAHTSCIGLKNNQKIDTKFTPIII